MYSYGAVGIGLETNVSIASQVSVTLFPTMPDSKYAEGWGFDGGIGGGELVVGSINGSESGGYPGINVTIGVGASLLPIEVSGFYSFTTLKPLSELANANTMADLLKQTKSYAEGELRDLNKRRQDILDNCTCAEEEDATKEIDQKIEEQEKIIEGIEEGIEELEERL